MFFTGRSEEENQGVPTDQVSEKTVVKTEIVGVVAVQARWRSVDVGVTCNTAPGL